MLYKFGFHFHIVDLWKLLIVLVFVLFMWIWKGDRKKWQKILINMGTIIGTLFLLYVFIINPIMSYIEIKHAILLGNTEEISGEVCNFSTQESFWDTHTSESFSIEGVEFEYYGRENYGYCKPKWKGGIIKEDGQKIKITYYNQNGENVICYIEEIVE